MGWHGVLLNAVAETEVARHRLIVLRGVSQNAQSPTVSRLGESTEVRLVFMNDCELTSTTFRRLIDSIWVIRKASEPMYVNVDGSSMPFSKLESKKAPASMRSRPSDNVTEFNEVYEKTPTLIEVISGLLRVAVARLVHPINAYSSITSIFSGTITSIRSVHPLKAYDPTVETLDAKVMPVMSAALHGRLLRYVQLPGVPFGMFSVIVYTPLMVLHGMLSTSGAISTSITTFFDRPAYIASLR